MAPPFLSSSEVTVMDDFNLVESDFAFTVLIETPRSPALPFSPSTIMDGFFSPKSFSYRKLPSKPLRLSVLKLDGSSFDIVVTKMATIADLRQSVEAVFSHMPKKGPGKISWPHVWGQFCLCYDGQKLLTETDHLKNYGIKDGDQLRFIRHVSNSCNVRRRRSKKRIVIAKQKRGSSSKVSSYHQKDQDGGESGEEIGLESIVIEKGKIQHFNNDDGGVKNIESKLTSFWGGLVTCARLVVMRRSRSEGRMCPMRLARGLLFSFRKINFYRKKRFYRKHAEIEWC